METELTENRVDDASQLAPIVAQIESDISKLGTDGAYETADCRDLLEYNAIKGLIPAMGRGGRRNISL